MRIMLIPFSVVSVALLGAALIVVVIKTILFQRRFKGKTFSQWLYFDNASIYSSGKKQDRIWKNLQNWLTWLIALLAMISIVFLFLS